MRNRMPLSRYAASRVPWQSRLPSTLMVVSGLLLLSRDGAAQHAHPAAATVQASHVSGAQPEGHSLSAKAREQVAAVAQAVARLQSPDSLRAGGFRPVFGMIPTMGVHWVNLSRMMQPVNALEPSQLMVSTIGGESRLVGVAYAFLGQAAQAPDLFDGDQDVWHSHPDLAPAGMSVVMLHVWFVPSPDGPFAGHNSWLPYWAAGVQPPADSMMSTPVSATRVRQLALALAESVAPMDVVRSQPGKSPVEIALAQVQGEVPAPSDVALPPGVEARRDSLRSAIPRLNAARDAGDRSAWDREADATIAVWKQVRDAYLAAIPTDEARARVAAFYQEMETGGHGH